VLRSIGHVRDPIFICGVWNSIASQSVRISNVEICDVSLNSKMMITEFHHPGIVVALTLSKENKIALVFFLFFFASLRYQIRYIKFASECS